MKKMDDLNKNENDTIIGVMADSENDNYVSDMETKLFWEYELSRGKWIKYENVINKKLNESIANGVAEFELEESKLQVDFNSMKQKNLDTGFVRSVRCAIRNTEGVNRVWEYIDSKGRWRSMDPTSTITLESAFVNGSGNVKILLSGINFIADFDSDLIRSDNGLTEYKIRFQVANAEPSMSAKPVPRVERLRAIKRIAAMTDTHSLENKRKAMRENDTSGNDDNSEKQSNELRTRRKRNTSSKS